jgi:hypothetical protein
MGLDLPNPFRKDEPRSAPPPAVVGQKEWARLYVMAFVLVLVVGTMIAMKKMTDTLNRPKDRPGPGQVDFKVRDSLGGTAGQAAPPADAPEAPPKKVIEVPAPPAEEGVDFRALAAPFRDGEEKIVKETPEFISLVSVFLKSVTREGLARKVTPDLTADRAFLEPAKNRGAVFRTYGRLIQIYTERIDATTPENVEFVYLGVMQEYPTNRTVFFYLPEKPMDPATGKPVEFQSYRKRGDEFVTDWVEVEGIFLRQYVYPSQLEDDKGNTYYARAAAMFGKTLRLAKKPEFSDPRGSFVFIVGGLAVVLAVTVIVGGVITRKHSSGSLRMKMAHLRRQKDPAGAGVAAPGAAPASEGPVPAAEPPKAHTSVPATDPPPQPPPAR